MTITFSAKVDQWKGKGGWIFVRVPHESYADLKEISVAGKKGFGSIKVETTVGATTWKTSVFPDNESETFLLFLKKAVRSAEKIEVGDKIELSVTLTEL